MSIDCEAVRSAIGGIGNVGNVLSKLFGKQWEHPYPIIIKNRLKDKWYQILTEISEILDRLPGRRYKNIRIEKVVEKHYYGFLGIVCKVSWESCAFYMTFLFAAVEVCFPNEVKYSDELLGSEEVFYSVYIDTVPNMPKCSDEIIHRNIQRFLSFLSYSLDSLSYEHEGVGGGGGGDSQFGMRYRTQMRSQNEHGSENSERTGEGGKTEKKGTKEEEEENQKEAGNGQEYESEDDELLEDDELEDDELLGDDENESGNESGGEEAEEAEVSEDEEGKSTSKNSVNDDFMKTLIEEFTKGEEASGSSGDVSLEIENEEERRDFNLPHTTATSWDDIEEYISDTYVDKEVFRKFKGTFDRVVEFVSQGEATPRIDEKKMIKNMIRGLSPYTAFRREKESGRILLMVDTSASMSRFHSLLPYFIELSRIMKQHVILIINSNAVPLFMVIEGKPVKTYMADDYYYDEQLDYTFKLYDKLLRNYNIKFIVAFTDWDGVSIYEMLLRRTNARLIALDVYMASILEGEPPRKPSPAELKRKSFLPEELQNYKNRIDYWYGVSNFEDVLYILNREL